MAATNLAPIEAIALAMARADMHYVATSLIGLPPSAAAAEIALVQYGAMAAYEAQLHFGKTLDWRLAASWDPATAKAARMSSKFFADTKRNLDGVVTHFDELLQANHGAFFPPDRRGPEFDFLRRDLSVVMLDEVPYTSLVSAHYMTGLEAEQVGDLATVGPAIGRLSTGCGNVAGALLNGSGIDFHGHAQVRHFEFFDATSTVALPRLFGGELAPSVAAALLTIHSAAASARQSYLRSLCSWCEVAARKHQFVALFQSLTALDVMRKDGVQAHKSAEIMAFLDEPESVWVLGQSKLRNGLVHLGLQDIAQGLSARSAVDDVFRLYTGQAPAAVARRVQDHLNQYVDALTRWMLAPTADGESFIEALHRPDED